MDRLSNAASDWKDFQNSPLWKEMEAELKLWLEQIRSQLEDQSAATADGTPPLDYGQLRHLQGSALFCRRALALPQMLMERSKEIQDDDYEA